ncbi:MAG TPA: primosomal protein N' [Candidatus Saccharimonadales bacterium]|nr:primosomal protein N' [Candidatus Saccharimonadales bacterium]
MHYYEVLIADGHYHSSAPLTYSSEGKLEELSVVTVPLRNRNVTGFVIAEASSPPQFKVKDIKSVVSQKPLPYHCLELAHWLEKYYACTLAEALRQFAPSRPSVRRSKKTVQTLEPEDAGPTKSEPLTNEQRQALRSIESSPSTTLLLHGETGSGKTRLYMELAKRTLSAGKSVILLTPEISLTSQLLMNTRRYLKGPVYVLHSQLGDAERKKIWFEILEAKGPITIIGPRSALFTPVNSLGLIVLDEAHEPAYKQDQNPYYHAARVASQLGSITGAKVVLGTATPTIADYYLASQRSAVIRMSRRAITSESTVATTIVDLKDRSIFSKNNHLSNILIDEINATLKDKKQVIIYLNRRGSARMILCTVCSWQFQCPNCDISLVYHSDQHLARCHICGYKKSPPVACPKCNNPEIIYRSIGTKSLFDEVVKLFPEAVVRRFDSDNITGEHLHDQYDNLLKGKVDILVGTQLLAKGLDLPRLGLVGVVSAEASLSLPDYTAEERSFQLLYQIIGRVGRGHGDGKVIVQSYDPQNLVIKSALSRDWQTFYKHSLVERRQFRFPPFSYLLQLTCRRATVAGAQKAADRLKHQLRTMGFAAEIIGPSPSFYARRGKYHYYQLVVKAKDRGILVKMAAATPADWQVNLDPVDLL